jgi:hypothetical protein
VGRYDNTIPTRFLAPIDCSKIPAPDPIFQNIPVPDPSEAKARVITESAFVNVFGAQESIPCEADCRWSQANGFWNQSGRQSQANIGDGGFFLRLFF